MHDLSENIAASSRRFAPSPQRRAKLPTAPTVEDGGGWIEWAGGYIPAPGAIVQTRFRNGRIGQGAASDFYWLQFGSSDDIVAYRIVQPAAASASVEDYMIARLSRAIPEEPTSSRSPSHDHA